MPDGREPGGFGPILSEVNERDTPALLQLTDLLARRPSVGLEIARFVGGCGFGAPGSPYSDGLAPLGFDVDARGAKAFTDILTTHPGARWWRQGELPGCQGRMSGTRRRAGSDGEPIRP